MQLVEIGKSKAILQAMAPLALVMGLTAIPAHAQFGYASEVVMTGLNNPRGLSFNPANGALYVAEAGSGGPLASDSGVTSAEGGKEYYGATSSVSQYLNGVQSRVLTGLPSLAADGGGSAVGLTDIAFTSAGDAYGIIGLGGNTDSRITITSNGFPGSSFGQMVSLSFAGNSFTPFADLTQYERDHNPDGGTLGGGGQDYDSNPYGLTATPDGFVAVDAGGNDALKITSAGAISTISSFSPVNNPLFGTLGGPTSQAVPTSITMAPDGTLFVGTLTGFPFAQGASSIYKIASDNSVTALTGFTNVIDVAYGADNNLYVLQYTTTGIAGPPSAGELFRVNPTTGDKTLLLSDPLLTPGGLAIASDGSFYITNNSTSAGGGQVIHVVAAPEPSAAALLAFGGLSAVLPLVRRRRRARM